MTLTTCVCLQCRMECCDVPAETLYDVLHDIEYRKKWDSNVIETFDIARLTVNADVGYYSCEQTQSKTPTPQSPSRPPPLTSPLCGHSCGQAAQRPACRDGELSSPWACSLTYTLKKVPPQTCADTVAHKTHSHVPCTTFLCICNHSTVFL